MTLKSDESPPWVIPVASFYMTPMNWFKLQPCIRVWADEKGYDIIYHGSAAEEAAVKGGEEYTVQLYSNSRKQTVNLGELGELMFIIIVEKVYAR